MDIKDYFISKVTGLGFKVCQCENNNSSYTFIRIKQYRMLTYNTRFPFKLLEKKNYIDMTINEDGSFNVNYDYKISNIYDIVLEGKPVDDVVLRNVFVEDIYDKGQIAGLLEIIENDIKEINIVKLEEFSWR